MSRLLVDLSTNYTVKIDATIDHLRLHGIGCNRTEVIRLAIEQLDPAVAVTAIRTALAAHTERTP